MSSQKYASPLTINIKPSHIGLGVLLLVHLGALVLLLPLQLPLVLKIMMGLVVVFSNLVTLYYAGWGPAWPVVGNVIDARWPRLRRAVWDSDDQWRLCDGQQRTYAATLLPTTVVHPQLVVLNLRLTGQPWYCRWRSIVLLHDNIDPETFRRLRIRLRWYGSPVVDSSAALK
jgi:hypothetical protein